MNNLDDPRQEPYRYQTPDGLVYVWHGGAYIDICTVHNGQLMPTDHCLNVWDYHTDRPTIDRTREAFLATVADHYGSHRFPFINPIWWIPSP